MASTVQKKWLPTLSMPYKEYMTKASVEANRLRSEHNFKAGNSYSFKGEYVVEPVITGYPS